METPGQALRSMDKDGDGEISKREFAKWWKVIDGSRASVPAGSMRACLC
eukprot:COSAG01_NODE_31973_length_588_cov_1.161554_2_plen_49_part_00